MDLVELNLKDNNLGGQVPQCLTNFTYLKVLVLSSNQLSGILPSAFTHTKSLEYLDVQENNFEGKYSLSSWANHSKLQILALSSRNNSFQVENDNWFPTFQLKALRLTHCNLNAIPSFLLYQYDLLSVDLSHNKLVGTFPSWLLVNNTNLREMFLVNNSFSGTLKLPNTKHDSITLFDISHNNFNGPLPKNISMGEITMMDLSNNHFSGELPCDFLIGCFSLEMLNLSNNNFNGQIFPQYMNMASLMFIYLNNNNFSGKIGKGLQNFTSLFALDISNNKVSGKVPNWIDHSFEVNFLTKNRYDSYKGDILNFMTGMDLSNNDLFGDIPLEIGDLQGIKALNLSNNLLARSIPKSFSKLKNIESLDLSHNKLSGQIPRQLTELTLDYSVFNVSYNNLSRVDS
ncbi:hypothetical protein Patl1_34581 [Pistacia atlantica]|uniref:Uncharacterized protein n=1 Tax=Pistacia atlantica TaxID=434234 RepID=A0ACC0ZUG2_9ROSI|nr:hypothetical protein Patl1_34581 [Pistacia atlantica]